MTITFESRYLELWLASRHFAVPGSMVTAATARRLAGDWKGACAAARMVADIDLEAVRSTHGAAVAAAVEDDLTHLVPDLLRWHLPRDGGGSGLTPGRICLAVYGERRTTRLVADTVSPNVWSYSSQGVQLLLVESERVAPDHDWTRARYLWDDRATGGLLSRAGGGERTPFFDRAGRRLEGLGRPGDPVTLTERTLELYDAGLVREAWELAGVDTDEGFAEPDAVPATSTLLELPEPMTALLPHVAAGLRDWLTGPGQGSQLALRRLGAIDPFDGVTLSIRDGAVHADRLRYKELPSLPIVPRVAWQRLLDVDLLRVGLLTPGELHPLVGAALFPEAPDPGYHPRVDRDMPMMERVASQGLAVECGGQRHRLGWRDRRLAALDHTPEELDRERTMRTLGGQVATCVAALDAWPGSDADALPEPLCELRAYVLAATTFGHASKLTQLLDAGLDVTGIRDERGQTLLHLLHYLDGPPTPDEEDGPPRSDAQRLLPHLLAAGLSLDARDGEGYSPLGRVGPGASLELIRLMLKAGAHPHAGVPDTRRVDLARTTRTTTVDARIRHPGG